jgi:hypothetical protein
MRGLRQAGVVSDMSQAVINVDLLMPVFRYLAFENVSSYGVIPPAAALLTGVEIRDCRAHADPVGIGISRV